MVLSSEKETFEVIKEAVVTLPGVVAFANYTAKTEDEIQTQDISKAVELINTDDVFKCRIHIVLMNGVNIREVISEVQIRVKYELERLSKFTRNYIVDVVVDDVAII